MNWKVLIRHLFKTPCLSVRNDSSNERIETLRFSVPALRVGVLEYAAGQLTTNNKKLDGKVVKLYYPPEAVSGEKFLKSLETAPVVVGGHDNTTNENNKKIDGWAHTVSYDEGAKAAMITGVVKGNKEVAFIRGNLRTKDFGASAFVDIFDIKVESGVTPDGQEYNAIAKDLRVTHVALAQHVRDSKNKIKVLNAVVFNTAGNYNSEEKQMSEQITAEQIAAIVKNAVKEELSAQNAEDEIKELKNKIKNLEDEKEKGVEMKDGSGPHGKGDGPGDGKKDGSGKDEKDTAENEDDEEKEGETLENAKPSQALVSAVGTALNIDFGNKTPSFGKIATMLGIKEEDPALCIAAVNTKFAEMNVKDTSTTSNSADKKVEVF